jgi:hypothetical protein
MQLSTKTADKNDLQRFSEATEAEVRQLIAEQGKPEDLTDEWNSFPGFQALIDLLKAHEDVTYHGYIVPKARDDWRVTVEGFEVKNISADEVLQLMDAFDSADDKSRTKNPDDTYNVYFWWD